MNEEDFNKLAAKMAVTNPYLSLAEELKAIAVKCDEFLVVHGFTVQCSEAQVKEAQARIKDFFDYLIGNVERHGRVLQVIALKHSLEN